MLKNVPMRAKQARTVFYCFSVLFRFLFQDVWTSEIKTVLPVVGRNETEFYFSFILECAMGLYAELAVLVCRCSRSVFNSVWESGRKAYPAWFTRVMTILLTAFNLSNSPRSVRLSLSVCCHSGWWHSGSLSLENSVPRSSHPVWRFVSRSSGT